MRRHVQPEQLIAKRVGLHLIVHVEWLIRKVGTWHPDWLTLGTFDGVTAKAEALFDRMPPQIIFDHWPR